MPSGPSSNVSRLARQGSRGLLAGRLLEPISAGGASRPSAIRGERLLLHPGFAGGGRGAAAPRLPARAQVLDTDWQPPRSPPSVLRCRSRWRKTSRAFLARSIVSAGASCTTSPTSRPVWGARSIEDQARVARLRRRELARPAPQGAVKLADQARPDHLLRLGPQIRVEAGHEPVVPHLVALGPMLARAGESTVSLPGGPLEIEWGEDGRVAMTGPAAESFRGSFDWGDFA